MLQLFRKRKDNDVNGVPYLSTCTKIGYGLGHVLNDVCSAIWFTYCLLFFSLVVELGSVIAGLMMLIGQVVDACSTPIVGLISDRGKNVKYGKRKLWHLVGTVMLVVSVPLSYSPCLGCQNAETFVKLLYYIPFICIFQVGWAFVQISHLSLAVDLTVDKRERTQLMAIRSTMAVLSNITVYVVAWTVFATESGSIVINEGNMYQFQILVWASCGVGVVAVIAFHASVMENSRRETLPPPTNRRPMSVIFKKAALYQIALLYSMGRLYGNMIQSFIPLYVHSDLKLTNVNVAIVPLVMFVSSFVTSFLTYAMNTHFGRKLAFLTGSVVALGGVMGVLLGTDDLYRKYFVYMVAVFLGSAQSMFLVTGLSLIADFIGNDTTNGAFVYGVMSFVDKVLSGVVIASAQAVHPHFEENQYYRYCTAVVCGIAIIIATGCTLSLKEEPRRQEEPLEEPPSPL